MSKDLYSKPQALIDGEWADLDNTFLFPDYTRSRAIWNRLGWDETERLPQTQGLYEAYCGRGGQACYLFSELQNDPWLSSNAPELQEWIKSVMQRTGLSNDHLRVGFGIDW